MFNAILIDKSAQQYHCQLTTLTESDLPQGDVLVEVLYSTINYKDALAITGKSPVVRQFPMIPGIDFVARVADSQHPDYQSGQLVILNGWGVGEKHWGGLAQKARVNGDWLVPLPQAFSPKTAMARYCGLHRDAVCYGLRAPWHYTSKWSCACYWSCRRGRQYRHHTAC